MNRRTFHKIGLSGIALTALNKFSLISEVSANDELPWEQKTFKYSLGNFKLQSGKILKDAFLLVDVQGKLNKDKSNALNNFILPIQVEDDFLQELFKAIEANPGVEVSVDLENQKLYLESSSLSTEFEINPYKKECLLNNYDDIDYLIARQNEINVFENQRVFIF